MKLPKSFRAQRGATLVTGLILLTLLTLSVSVAFVLSNNNLKSVGNMQSRAEAAAAAEAAVEKLISSDAIFLAPAATTAPANEQGVAVSIAAPTCVKTVPVDAQSSADATPTLYQQGVKAAVASGYMLTDWEIVATATSAAAGASVETHQGIRIMLPAEPNPCP